MARGKVYETKVMFIVQTWVEDPTGTMPLRDVRKEAEKVCYDRLMKHKDNVQYVYIDVKLIP